MQVWLTARNLHFSRIFAKERPILGEGSFKAYLYKTARHLALRHKQKHRLVFLRLDELGFEPHSDALADNLVWEKVCAEVMDNQLQKPIGGLRLPVPLAEQYRDMRHKKLIDLIDKPQWSGSAPNGEPFVKQAEDTLIPDLISIPSM